MTARPLHPRIAFRLGITGTRNLPEAARAQLRPRIEALLDTIATTAQAARNGADIYDTTNPLLLRLITPLAEGADRLVAEVARAKGWQIEVVLPFAAETYRDDFATPATPGVTADACLAEFDQLLAAAAQVTTLDGDGGPDHRNRSYEAAGRMVVRNCDLLIALWDGETGVGRRGGTAEIIRFAARFGPPIWWLHPTEDRQPCVLLDTPDLRRRAPLPDAANSEAWLAVYLKGLFTPPAPHPEHAHGLLDRFAQGWRKFRKHGPFDGLRTLLGQAPPKTGGLAGWYAGLHGGFLGFFRKGWDSEARLHAAPGVLAAEATPDWLRSSPSFPDQEGAPAEHWRSAYAAPDAYSNAYAGRYRSGYVVVSILIVLALACAVMGLVLPKLGKITVTGLELALLLLLLGVVLLNTLQHWHQRFLLYRLVAELCRKQAHLAALGWSLPLYRVDSAAAAAGAREGWVGWYFNALSRAAPMVSGLIDPPRLEAMRHALRNGLLMGQVHYHGRNQPRSTLAAARLVRAGEWLFLITVFVVAFKLLLLRMDVLSTVALFFGLLAALLPVISAGFFVLRAYAELNLVADQSAVMLHELAEAAEALDSLDLTKPLASQDLAADGYALASTMLADVEGWARLFRAKVIEAG
ncbi:MAG: hypothetical protein IOD03_21355 [Methylocystis sp.]|nr:hypothetical protein [Methylocystis sp.]